MFHIHHDFRPFSFFKIIYRKLYTTKHFFSFITFSVYDMNFKFDTSVIPWINKSFYACVGVYHASHTPMNFHVLFTFELSQSYGQSMYVFCGFLHYCYVSGKPFHIPQNFSILYVDMKICAKKILKGDLQDQLSQRYT